MPRLSMCSVSHVQHTLRHQWDELHTAAARAGTAAAAPQSQVIESTSAALAALRRLAHEVRPARVHVLVRFPSACLVAAPAAHAHTSHLQVTGSLYLVGNVLRMLKR